MGKVLAPLLLFTFILASSAIACGSRTSCMATKLEVFALGECWSQGCTSSKLQSSSASKR